VRDFLHQHLGDYATIIASHQSAVRPVPEVDLIVTGPGGTTLVETKMVEGGEIAERLLQTLESVTIDRGAIRTALTHRVFGTDSFRDALANFDRSVDVVADAPTAFAEVLAPAFGDSVPDGVAGIPIVWSHLSPARRRDVVVRLAILLAVALIYIRALTRDSDELAALVGALATSALAYATVMTAIEEADATLAAERDDAQPEAEHSY
jgi:hypothetical protein